MQVTLEEFSAVMKGELNGRSPMDSVLAVFAVMSRSDGNSQNDGLITLGKLQTTCRDFEVCIALFFAIHISLVQPTEIQI